MSYFIRWSDRAFSEIDKPIVVEFKDNESNISGEDDIYDEIDDPSLYTSEVCIPSKVTYYRCNIGTFRFALDSKGNAIIEHFVARDTYVKLPSEIFDPSGQMYLVKRIDNISGGNILKGVVIPEGVEILGGLFAKSYSLMDVFFPQSLMYFGEIFWNVPQFEQCDGGRVWYSGSQEKWKALLESKSSRGLMDYTPYDKVVRFYDSFDIIRIPEIEVTTGKGKKALRGNVRICNPIGDMIIPSTWKENDSELTITRIGRNSFACNEFLTSIIVPPTIHTIARDAFYGCKELKTVVFLPGEDNLSIEDGAFFNCSNLSKVEFGRKTIIGDYCFACEDTSDVVLYLETDSDHQLQISGNKTFNNRSVEKRI